MMQWIWNFEQDAEAASLLIKMEQYYSPGLRQEDQLLQHLVSKCQQGWVEPMNQLATL